MAAKLSWEWVTGFLSQLPETEFVPPSGHFPRGVMRVRGKVIGYPAGGARGSPPDAHAGEEFIFIKTAPAEREALFSEDPVSFFTTPHYQSAPGVIVRLSTVDPDQFEELLIEAWRVTAPKRLVAGYERRKK